MSTINNDGKEFKDEDFSIFGKDGEGWKGESKEDAGMNADPFEGMGINPMFGALGAASNPDILEILRDVNKLVEEGTDEDDIEIDTGEEDKFVEKTVKFDFEQLKGPRMHGGTHAKHEDVDDVEEKDVRGYDRVDRIRADEVVTLSGNPRKVTTFRARNSSSSFLNDIRAEGMALAPRLKRRLRAALDAQAKVARERALRRGKLDAGRAHMAVSAGSNEVFSNKAYRKDIKTAITLVLDDSGSMHGAPGKGKYVGKISSRPTARVLNTKMGCAGVLAYAFGEVCKSLNVPLEIVSYQTGTVFCHNHHAIVYKQFDEPWAKVKDRMGNYTCDAGGDVPYDGCGWALGRMAQRPEENRIVFFISDANECNVGIEKLGDLSKEAMRKANINLVGVGIMTEFMTKFMGSQKAIDLPSAQELTDAVLIKMVKIINPVL